MKFRSRQEEFYNSLSHFFLAVISLFFLFDSSDSFKVFFFFSFVTFASSFVYHATSNHKHKLFFCKVDVASIYWLIAATVYDLLPRYAGIGFLGLAILLSIPTLVMWMNALYSDVALIMLAVVAFMLPMIIGNFRITSLLGLAAYAVGLPFYFLGNKLGWMHTVWHVFVCMGWSIYVIGKLNYGFV